MKKIREYGNVAVAIEYEEEVQYGSCLPQEDESRSGNRYSGRDRGGRYGRGLSAGNVSSRGEDIYRELTLPGKVLCGLLGLMEEILLYILLGISLTAAPALVTCFLWFLLAMVTAGVLLAADLVAAWGRRIISVYGGVKCR